MPQKILINRLPDTLIREKPTSESYHPATALWLREKLGLRLTTAEKVELERYLFEQRFPLQ